jgi:hypothetical protein
MEDIEAKNVLSYAPVKVMPRAAWTYALERVLCWASYLIFVIAFIVMINGCRNMDEGRLFYEGGSQYFQENFPYKAVFSLSGAGVLCALIGIVMNRKNRNSLIMAGLANLAFGLFFVFFRW